MRSGEQYGVWEMQRTVPEEPILDACCGGRMFWFDKEREDVLYMDHRREYFEFQDGRTVNVDPDVIADFREMPFQDESFEMVVFDPPHLTRGGEDSWMRKKYGVLNKATWKADLKRGFDECFRVLVKGGVLVFKWNEYHIPVREVVEASGYRPLFGHPTGRSGRTKWMVFRKA